MTDFAALLRAQLADLGADFDQAPLFAAAACPLCGQQVAGHDDAACKAKMAACEPVGILNVAGLQTPVVKAAGYLTVSHDMLCDTTDHQCTADCPPPWSPPPVPLGRRVRYGLRRAWWWTAGLRVAHKSRIDQDADD